MPTHPRPSLARRRRFRWLVLATGHGKHGRRDRVRTHLPSIATARAVTLPIGSVGSTASACGWATGKTTYSGPLGGFTKKLYTRPYPNKSLRAAAAPRSRPHPIRHPPSASARLGCAGKDVIAIHNVREPIRRQHKGRGAKDGRRRRHRQSACARWLCGHPRFSSEPTPHTSTAVRRA